MIIEQVIAKLKAAGIEVEAFKTSKKVGIAYEFVNLTSDKVLRQDRLTLTIIDADYKKALEKAERVKGTLLTLGDSVCTQDINSVELGGGGTLLFEDAKTYHIKQIYILKSKERGVQHE